MKLQRPNKSKLESNTVFPLLLLSVAVDVAVAVAVAVALDVAVDVAVVVDVAVAVAVVQNSRSTAPNS